MSSAKKAREIFETVVDLPADKQFEVVQRECGGDAELAAEVHELLRTLHEGGEFLSSPTAAIEPLRPPAEQAGDQFGPYKLLQQIGEGGFGTVFMAEQSEPIRRRVALKVIKLGMDTKQVIARFEAERQALAMMDHPNIARVFDAGATDTGRPYFAMELVSGLPITEYCDRERLSLAERVALMIPVCEAVQHAHHKGIIHRDLKPNNVLVTMQNGKPLPKVIDFGVAKAISQRLTERTLFTEFGQFIGTPEYMSPEQADMPGLDVDARSDVYSLGVLLYELLAGAAPFDGNTLRSKGFDEMRRIIREDEPPRLSLRAATLASSSAEIAKRRGVDPAALASSLRNEHEWIVMRCMEKDRNRRYVTPAAFADDLGRLLKNEPVNAAPPSTGYRIRKFVRRHRREVTLASVGSVLVLLGLVGTSLGMAWALREREAARNAQAEATNAAETARQQAEHAERRSNFLQSTLLRPQPILENSTTLADGLRRQAEAVFGPGHPDIDALMVGVGAVLATDVSRRQDALAVLSRATGEESADQVLMARSAVGFVWGEYGEAVELLREAEAIRAARYGTDAIETATTREALALAMLDNMRLRPDAAAYASEIADVYRDVIRVYRDVLSPSHTRILDAVAGYGYALYSSGEFEDGLRELESVIDDILQSAQMVPGMRWLAANTLAAHYNFTMQQDRMVEMYLAAGRLAIELYAKSPSHLSMILEALSDELREAGASEAADKILAMSELPQSIADLYHRAVARAGFGDHERAAEILAGLLAEVIDDSSTLPLVRDASVDLLTNTLISVLTRGGQHQEALEIAERRAGELRSSPGDTHHRLRALELARLEALEAAGRSAEADAAGEALIAEARSSRPPDTLASIQAVRLLASFARRRGDTAREVEFADLSRRLRQETRGPLGRDDFEGQPPGAFPAGWFPPAIDDPGQLVFVTDERPYRGSRCVRIDGLPGVDARLASRSAIRNLMKVTNAADYQGKAFKLSAAIRVEGGIPGRARAQMWARVDRPNNARPHFFENMADRPVTSSEWAVYEISGRIDDDAEQLHIGVMAYGEAVVWIDDVRFEILD